MNKPTYIIIHCSATRGDKDFTEKQINDSHVAAASVNGDTTIISGRTDV